MENFNVHFAARHSKKSLKGIFGSVDLQFFSVVIFQWNNTWNTIWNEMATAERFHR